MSHRLPLAAALAAAGVFAHPAGAAVVARNASLFQQASSQVGHANPVGVTASNSWNGSTDDLVAKAVAKTRNSHDRVVTTSKMTAHWDSPTGGRVEVLDHGFDVTAPNPDIDFAAGLIDSGPDGAPDWTYTFTADERGAFNLSFGLRGRGDLLDLGKWEFGFAEVGGASRRTTLADGFGGGDELSGSLSHRLQAGHTYTVSLTNREGFSASGPLASLDGLSGHERGRFDWDITQVSAAVPEPAAWAMMITGFAFAGAVLRRRRALTAAV